MRVTSMGGGVALPNVSLCVQENEVYYNPMPHNYLNDYLTFVALEDTTFKLTIGSAVSESILSSISYSTDNGETWTTTNNVNSQTVTITTPTIHEGDKVLWKGSGTGVSTTINNSNRPSTSSIFSSSGRFNAEGNIMSLIYGDDFSDKNSVQGTYNFALLFYSYNMPDTAKIVSAKDMVFPIKSVPTCCYFRMFQGCTLVEAPSVIDVESVGTSGCTAMFWGCANLKTTPKFQATTLGVESCRAMFETCTGLETVTEIPTAVSADITSYNSMFNGCSGLTSITIGDGVTYISSSMCINCYSLASVTIGSGVTSIGDYAFRNCRGLTSIEIPDSVTSIGQFTFNGCSSLSSATINGGSIGNSAFQNCSGLTSVTIGSGVTSINYAAFGGCTNLRIINIPDSVIEINDYAFTGCTSLPVENDIRYADTYLIGPTDKTKQAYTIKEGTRFIGYSAFSYCYNLTSIEIPNSITKIAACAFEYCSGLTSVNIPDSVTSIGSSVFSNCNGLISVTIGSGVTSIDSSAFIYCYGLTSVIIPDSVTNIGANVFYGCTGLTSITIGSGVTNIGNQLLYNNMNLTSITCKAITAPTITNTTFKNINTNGTLYVPQGSSGYDTWMGTSDYYLGKYNWTKIEQ